MSGKEVLTAWTEHMNRVSVSRREATPSKDLPAAAGSSGRPSFPRLLDPTESTPKKSQRRDVASLEPVGVPISMMAATTTTGGTGLGRPLAAAVPSSNERLSPIKRPIGIVSEWMHDDSSADDFQSNISNDGAPTPPYVPQSLRVGLDDDAVLFVDGVSMKSGCSQQSEHDHGSPLDAPDSDQSSVQILQVKRAPQGVQRGRLRKTEGKKISAKKTKSRKATKPKKKGALWGTKKKPKKASSPVAKSKPSPKSKAKRAESAVAKKANTAKKEQKGAKGKQPGKAGKSKKK